MLLSDARNDYFCCTKREPCEILTREMPLGRWRVSVLAADLKFMKPSVTEATAEQVLSIFMQFRKSKEREKLF